MRVILFVLFITTSLYANSQNISLQLSWKNQFQFAGFYVAKEKGFYDAVDLNVTLKEYSKSVDIVRDVVSGKSTYGIGQSSLILSRNKGLPVVVLSAIYQSTPSILITINQDIKSPADLVGKKLMITDDEVESAPITTMLSTNGISKEKIVLLEHSFNYKDLVDGKTDAMACYISNEPYNLDEEGIKYRVFNPKDYNYNFYGDILFSSEKELQEHSQRAKSFIEATNKGWLWAFEHIEESAQIIYEKYNTQNKSLESLIYEGKILKNLAIVDEVPFGHISETKFDAIAEIYKVSGLLKGEYSLEGFFGDFAINKFLVNIGVLAKRGKALTIKRWIPIVEYLNKKIDTHNFSLKALDFQELEESVKNTELDFVITNNAYYVVLEKKYGISRIATLVNGNGNIHASKEFGSVVFTHKNNNAINEIKDLRGKHFGAVSELSFGGWIIAYEELFDNGVSKSDVSLEFLETHDAVVNAVLSGEIEAGLVRTDTLERMSQEGKIDLNEIKVLAPKTYKDFPYLASTKLYPEWPIAKSMYSEDALANRVLSELILYKPTKNELKIHNIAGWTVPLNYAPVHQVLQKLKLPPYDNIELEFTEVVRQYALYIYLLVFFLTLLIVRIVYQTRINSHLQHYSDTLNKEVSAKTQELREANEKLQVIASTDVLTGISNRRHFLKLAKKYFDIARRNGQDIGVLALDLDYFKNINDTYGHQIGDIVLKEFTNVISSLLRESDLFGRVGGEEFCIVLQNTAEDGSLTFAQKICNAVESMLIESGDVKIKITVSIGVVVIAHENSFDELMCKSDIALYKAKKSGRNKFVLFEQ